jgi:hypothetical protein
MRWPFTRHRKEPAAMPSDNPVEDRRPLLDPNNPTNDRREQALAAAYSGKTVPRKLTREVVLELEWRGDHWVLIFGLSKIERKYYSDEEVLRAMPPTGWMT